MRKLGAGVIGLRMGRSHVAGFKAHPDVDVVAVCDVQEETAWKVAEEYRVETWTTDYRELVEREDVDLVSV